MDPVSLKSLTTWGVFCSRYLIESKKSQPAECTPNRERSCLVYILSRKTKMINGWLSCLHQRTSVLFRVFSFFKIQSEIDLTPTKAQMLQKNEPHKTFLLLLPAVEGRGTHGSLGASVTTEESNKPEGEVPGSPSSVFLRAGAAVTPQPPGSALDCTFPLSSREPLPHCCFL